MFERNNPFKLIFIALAILLTGCSDCSYEHLLKNYQALSESRLELLHKQIGRIISDNKGSINFLERESIVSKYPGLVDIEFNGLDLSHQVLIIGGCFDNKLIMRFGGLRDSLSKNEHISISWGENPSKKETLWVGKNAQ